MKTHVYNEATEECSCGCSPYDHELCLRIDCPHSAYCREYAQNKLYDGWQIPGCASILHPAAFARRKGQLWNSISGREWVALTSGGFDPLHSGHVSCILESAKKAKHLVVVVNGDDFLINKKGKAFMPLKVRCQIVSAIRGVKCVVPFVPSDTNDTSVCEALRIIKPDFFTKGGDRNIDNIPERKVCEELGIKIVQGMGDDKLWSSSGFLKEWEKFILNRG